MNELPRDPAILFSYINTKLRNGGMTLARLCRELDADEEEICSTLAAIGYRYSEERNRFE